MANNQNTVQQTVIFTPKKGMVDEVSITIQARSLNIYGPLPVVHFVEKH